MNRAERLYRIENLLRHRRAVSSAELRRDLEISTSTLKRDLEILRDRMRAPIVYDRTRHAYRFDAAEPGGGHELPGLWFSDAELHALFTFYHFICTLEPGLLADNIEPLKTRLESLLARNAGNDGHIDMLAEIRRRVRILPQAARHGTPACFQLVAHAVVTRKRLAFAYHGRSRDDVTERIVSPQRLVHYRDNWYLDVWDHGRRALRTFAIERIRDPKIDPRPVRDISDTKLDRHFSEAYGIFAGRPRRKALLRFRPERARWVAEETWHPEQKGWKENGAYLLEIPYADDRELVLDILRYGPDVEVLKPKSLRDKILEKLHEAVTQYEQSGDKVTG